MADLLAVAAPLAVLAPLVAAEGPMFGPEPDSSVSRTYRERTELELKNLTELTIEGDIEGQALQLRMELRGESALWLSTE